MRAIGSPPLPWQRLVLYVACEVEPSTGMPAYREVVFSTPRQSGKSTLLLGLALYRCLVAARLLRKSQRVVYSAQTGFDARRKLIEDWVPQLARSPLSSTVTNVRRAAGSEGVTFVGGSVLQPVASTASAGHGRTVDTGIIDEAFNDVDDRREQAMVPAMLTIDTAQLWVTSTAGTDASLYFRRKTDAGRLAVEQGLTQSLAYFEWSAADELDLDDEETWSSFMPALGHTQSIESVRHAKLTMLPEEFARALGNRWTRTDTQVIPWASWLDCRDTSATPTGFLHFGVDVNAERSGASIVVASEGGRSPVEMVAHEPGLAWVAPRLAQLYADHGGSYFIVEGSGPAGSIVPELERLGLPLKVVGRDEMSRASGAFYDAVVEHLIDVRPAPRLDDAVAAARKRIRGDAFTWARRDASADISPLVAASLAVWSARSDLAPAVF